MMSCDKHNSPEFFLAFAVQNYLIKKIFYMLCCVAKLRLKKVIKNVKERRKKIVSLKNSSTS